MKSQEFGPWVQNSGFSAAVWSRSDHLIEARLLPSNKDRDNFFILSLSFTTLFGVLG
jgi:CRISPR/Cas system-associated endoribonuclease Cas2